MEAVEQGGELTNYILISGEIVNFSQSVRVTVRCHVGEFRKEADLALPASSSFNEMITEVTDLVGAPSVSRPWRISTAGGRLVDPSAPLSATQLVDGSVVLLSPSEELPAPVIRDSAEALIASSGSEQSARGIVQLWVIGALIALGAVVGFVTRRISPGLLCWPEHRLRWPRSCLRCGIAGCSWAGSLSAPHRSRRV